MRLALRHEMQEIDRRAVAEFAITEDDLMERAGTLMAEKIMALPGLGLSHRIGIFCGLGNNGGDGLVVARKLIQKGFAHIHVWTLEAGRASQLFQENLQRFQKAGGSAKPLTESVRKSFDFNKYEMLIDAFFGTGLDRKLDDSLIQFIEQINRQKVSVVSLDVPSGLDVNRGITWGAAIRAVTTLTCGLAKPGFFFQEGPSYVGRIEILNMGFPPQLLREIANTTFLIGVNSAKGLLRPRRQTANKSHFGKLLVISGSPQMKGAAGLVSIAAARMGAGYVTIASPSFKLLNQAPPDFLQTPWTGIKELDFEKYSAVVIGPGLGNSPEIRPILQRLLSEGVQKVLIDADALTVLANSKMKELPSSWILTPHAGEMSRLISMTAQEIESDRLRAVKEAQQRWGATILLKGFRTVLFASQKQYIIGAGNAALAKAGTGDVLAGFIGSLMAQGMNTDRAAALGAYIHGRIADYWLKHGGKMRTLMASDLPKLLHKVLGEME